jgi:hypothetical protein
MTNWKKYKQTQELAEQMKQGLELDKKIKENLKLIKY